jgi:hypothetical protein
MFRAMTTTATPAQPRDISALNVWIACGIVYAVLIGFIVTNNYTLLNGPGELTESGLLEQAQNLVLLIGLILAIHTVTKAETPTMRGWLIIVSLGILYLLGEETSWGQHYFGWATTGVFAQINDQGETNIHNTAGGWFDQKPRALLLLGMILSTIVHPLVKHFRKGRGLIDNPWWLAPTLASLGPVIFSQLAALPKRIDQMDLVRQELDYIRWAEAEELFIYIFFISYLLSLSYRLTQRKRAGVTTA